MAATYAIGCAGWALPRSIQDAFPGRGTHLQRYSGLFHTVEINSSFYRPHQPKTYARWAQQVPDGFTFTVKVPKRITHELRLQRCDFAFARFFSEVRQLGDRLGALLVQLPPSLRYEPAHEDFFALMRTRYGGNIACEPRHPSWFRPELRPMWEKWSVSRVAADPVIVPEAAVPGGATHCVYFRLHGSPKMYYSNYAPEFLCAMGRALEGWAASGSQVWCVFDNTAEGAAISNALFLAQVLERATAKSSAAL